MLSLGIALATGSLFAGCTTAGNGSSSRSSSSSSTNASTGGASDLVVFTITGSASVGVQSYGDTAVGPDAVKTWNKYSVPFRATMPYQAPPAGPMLYSLFATFDSSGPATCMISLAGHSYIAEASPGSNLADPNAKQVCADIVGYAGGSQGWHQ